METGHSLFHFNLDCVVDYILCYEKKSDKYLALICQEPYKLVINISKEPLSFNHYTFKYNNTKPEDDASGLDVGGQHSVFCRCSQLLLTALGFSKPAPPMQHRPSALVLRTQQIVNFFHGVECFDWHFNKH